MEIILGLITLVWSVISFLIKVLIYITYFFPLLGAQILQFLNLWPTLWPFGNIY